MMKNKLLLTMLIIMVSISLAGVIVYVVSKQLSAGNAQAEEPEPTIEEIVSASVEIPEVTTSIANNNFARISMTMQTDSPEAAEELEQRDFMVKDIIIDELSEMTRANLEGRAGKEAFEKTVKERVDALMQEGEIVQIYTTSIVVQ
ncbi:flagellar basal body-associated protein FliL [Jeotgalibacillus sp. ET6]|uniref:flagellar basal body-associated protein FliL n=1 Tax=Jeotgalibacillus sp. ET6 TaxID=3037260 RepID=UPI002418372A|nr:flagellar basal body-associated protein FliL [Jeotgalibacillus sp. ET6]MDG5470297.1 flagellar basal body-associated protein FliL [Jeotgalibacillus sp. ET6]